MWEGGEYISALDKFILTCFSYDILIHQVFSALSWAVVYQFKRIIVNNQLTADGGREAESTVPVSVVLYVAAVLCAIHAAGNHHIVAGTLVTPRGNVACPCVCVGEDGEIASV